MNSSRKRFASLLLIVLLSSAIRLAAQPAPSGEIELSLRKLNELGTVLMIAAHPDDERTNLLAWFARGRHMRTAYLSITRGEGGQNLIGSEQGAALGVIRTQELLAARRIDGAEQFFTRAIDFGFSKTVAESLEKWGHQEALSDIVWIIRQYRPDVVILCFSGTSADGHGHHQASAILGKEAFEAAGDPSRFPEQLRYAQAWRAKKLVSAAGRGGRTNSIAPTVQIDTSGYNPFLGYSYDQLAALSRSQHRSQGFGNTGLGGPASGRDNQSPGVDVFEGIDHSWNRLPGGAAVSAIIEQAIREFNAEHPDKTIPLLVKARPLISSISDPIVKVKLAELDELIAKCGGIWAEALARQAEVTPGSAVTVAAHVYARLPIDLKVQSVGPEGVWSGEPLTAAGAAGNFELKIPASQPYSQPYWLTKPPSGDRYTVEDPATIGLADTPVEQMRFRLTVAGIPIEIVRPIVRRYTDRAEVERVRPLTIVPPVSVNLLSSVAMFPAAAPRKIQISVKANVANAAGDVRIDLPAGWKGAPHSQPFRMTAPGEERGLIFEVTPPADAASGNLRAIAVVDGREIAAGMQTISYPHIPVEVLFPASDMKLVRADIRVTSRRVGYIMGAGDEVPNALRELGLDVTMLSESDLAKSDLSGYDAIVAGVRAYNVRPDLRANHSRLLEYVNNGGTYVVQYMSAGAQNIGPYPITIPSGNGFRVTVENAPVTFTHPDSRLLQAPNRITPRDFEGWVQERGLLFPTQWDPKYETVLSTGDPGEKALEGGALWTRYGKGVYIFTSYAWFRELPAGVPGAYRLFANLLSAK